MHVNVNITNKILNICTVARMTRVTRMARTAHMTRMAHTLARMAR